MEAIANPALLGEDPQPQVTLRVDPDARRLTVEDNGIGMTAQEMVDALGTIARSGTKAFMERIAAKANGEDSQLIGQFGVGFYSVFMVADKVDVISRKGRRGVTPPLWSSDGKGTYTVTPIDAAEAPARGTRVVLHMMEDAKTLHRAAHAGAPDQGALGPCAGAGHADRQARCRAALTSPMAQHSGPSQRAR